MNDDETMAGTFRVGMALAYVERGLEMLTADAAQVSGEQSQRLIAGMERFGAARRALIPLLTIAPESNAHH